MARLVVITKNFAVAPHDLNDKWITIGRADDNLFQIDEPTISNRHCEARLTGGELVVRDMQSTNGTFVDGEKITAGTLKPGQTLRLGLVELRLEVPAPAAKAGSGTTKMPTQEPPKPASVAPVVSVTPKISPTSVLEPPKPAPAPVSKPVGPPVAPVEPGKKFQVLFVDDSMAFLETFTDLCSVLSERTWEIHTAPTADLALTLLQKIPMDLAVLDIGMPMLDGLQLMGIIRRRYPAIKLAVMTSNGNEARRADALANGAELFIEKPVTPDGIKTVFNMLNDLVSWTHRAGFSGALREIGLQEVIQMECVARHSSILEIRNQQMRGQIYIEAGMITHAAAGPLAGEAAFNLLLSQTGGEFQLKPFQPPPQHTLHGGWEFLLLEAARLNDEDTGLLSKKLVEAAAASHSPPGDSKNSFRDAPQNPA
jgi:pSer/pThr/pTyr-binding forkhead associated (FHA) protein